jgi:hypothetical protein
MVAAPAGALEQTDPGSVAQPQEPAFGRPVGLRAVGGGQLLYLLQLPRKIAGDVIDPICDRRVAVRPAPEETHARRS